MLPTHTGTEVQKISPRPFCNIVIARLQCNIRKFWVVILCNKSFLIYFEYVWDSFYLVYEFKQLDYE